MVLNLAWPSRFSEGDVRLMKACGSRRAGDQIKTGDVVVGAGVLESDESEAQVFTISEEGFGKSAMMRMRTIAKTTVASVLRTSSINEQNW